MAYLDVVMGMDMGLATRVVSSMRVLMELVVNLATGIRHRLVRVTMFMLPREMQPDTHTHQGGPKTIADEAMKLLGEGKNVEALNLTSIGLEGAPGDKDVLRARAAAFEALLKVSDNRNEMSWLNEGLVKAKAALQR